MAGVGERSTPRRASCAASQRGPESGSPAGATARSKSRGIQCLRPLAALRVCSSAARTLLQCPIGPQASPARPAAYGVGSGITPPCNALGSLRGSPLELFGERREVFGAAGGKALTSRTTSGAGAGRCGVPQARSWGGRMNAISDSQANRCRHRRAKSRTLHVPDRTMRVSESLCVSRFEGRARRLARTRARRNAGGQ